MIMNNKDKGILGENIAAKYLENIGYKILERNWRYSKFGEIDIIALDQNTIVFVEVKTRRGLGFGHPFEAIDSKKINQIQKTAIAYISQKTIRQKNYRIDGISIILCNPPKVDHLKNIS